jgi:MoxR-like ATPase
MVDYTKTKSQQEADEITALLRARTPLIWVVTREEARVERFLFEAAAKAKFLMRTWDVAQGCAEFNGDLNDEIGGVDEPNEVLKAIEQRARSGTERGVFVLRDLPGWLEGPIGMSVLRRVRNLAKMLPTTPQESAQALVVISPNGNVPPELAGHATVINWPLPDRTEIAALLDQLVELYDLKFENGSRDAAIDAAVGLTGEEASSCYSKSLVQLKRIDPVLVATEKKRVIAREGVLEWFDPLPGGLDAVGGLDGVKGWLTGRTLAYSPEARAYGLPAPKGVMLVGVPGCGKSLLAKAFSTGLGVPLLRLDMGALKSKFVGESEGNFRKALRVVETVGRCVLWIDEIEKALAGATQGAADGGVSSDALGTLLSWMQDRPGEAFVIATANKVEDLPPELLRKGRFDEIFFVDLPNESERRAVLTATLRKHGRAKVKFDVEKVAAACDGFTGSEIAEIVPDAMFAAFGDARREINSDDLINAAATVVPLSKTAAEKIAKLREWAKGRARPASVAKVTVLSTDKRRVRALDI